MATYWTETEINEEAAIVQRKNWKTFRNQEVILRPLKNAKQSVSLKVKY